MRLGGPQGRSRRVQETSPKPGLNSACSASLYRLRYPGPRYDVTVYVIDILRLRVCERRVLKRIFGPKRVEVSGAW